MLLIRERERRDPTGPSQQSNNRYNNDRDRSPLRRTRRVIVSNIPYYYTWQKLRELFRRNVGPVSFVELLFNEQHERTGSAIVVFPDWTLARDAVAKMDCYYLQNGTVLSVKEYLEVDDGQHGNRHDQTSGGVGSVSRRSNRDNNSGSRNWNEFPSSGSSSNPAANPWHTYSISQQLLESLRITCPSSSRVFVYNLDSRVNVYKLVEVFRIAGSIEKVEFPCDGKGRSSGFAFVSYYHPVEAAQAISMLNGQLLYNRPLVVMMNPSFPEGYARRLSRGILPEGLDGVGMGMGVNGEPLENISQHLCYSAAVHQRPMHSAALYNPPSVHQPTMYSAAPYNPASVHHQPPMYSADSYNPAAVRQQSTFSATAYTPASVHQPPTYSAAYSYPAAVRPPYSAASYNSAAVHQSAAYSAAPFNPLPMDQPLTYSAALYNPAAVCQPLMYYAASYNPA